jgi:hypothetical protein
MPQEVVVISGASADVGAGLAEILGRAVVRLALLARREKELAQVIADVIEQPRADMCTQPGTQQMDRLPQRRGQGLRRERAPLRHARCGIMMRSLQQPIGARGGAGHLGRCFLLVLGLALAGGCAHEAVPAPAADRPAAKAGTLLDETTDDVIDGPRWQYDRYFDGFIERVRRNWSKEQAARALEAERPGYAVSTVGLRVALLPNGRLRHVGVEKLSGSAGYDEVAVRAVGAGQPFDPPGPELARDGLLSFRLEIRFDARTGRTTIQARRP